MRDSTGRAYSCTSARTRPRTTMSTPTHPPADLMPLLTFDEVAAVLGVSVPTVRRWVRNGALIPSRLTRRTIRFRADDVRDFVDSKLAARRTR